MYLRVLLIDNRVATSFLPEDGDVVPNAIKLEQTIGTLVKEKQGNTGSPEPYLANSWTVSEDRKRYSFEFRPGLYCEDGSPITASTFRRSLIRLLKSNATHGDVPVFNQLQGWDAFRTSGASLTGIRASSSDTHLTFEFNRPVEGLLEFLAMPQFGHYCDANYDNSGNWIDPLRLVASGPYRVVSADSQQVTLTRRSGWFSLTERSPETISFINQTWPIPNIDDNVPTVVLHRSPNGDESLPGFVRVAGAPLFLNALVLSPFRVGPFQDPEYRRSFAARFTRELHTTPRPTTPSIYEQSLYLGMRPHQYTNAAPAAASGHQPIRILKMNSGTGLDVQHIERIITRILEEDGVKFEFVAFEKSPGFIKSAFSNREFDIRLARVDVGVGPQTWVLDMMFCSQLGISFPDHRQRVCSSVQTLKDQGISHPTAKQLEPLIQVLEDDATTVPAFHSGALWFFSRHIDLNRVSNHLIVPRFERMELK